MTTLEERFQASHPVLAQIGRADANGMALASPMMEEIAPDLSRLIREACWGVLWTRPALSVEQRSLITISVITALRRDDNLKGHIESGLDVGHSAERIVEIMIQLLYYVGAPMANTGAAANNGPSPAANNAVAAVIVQGLSAIATAATSATPPASDNVTPRAQMRRVSIRPTARLAIVVPTKNAATTAIWKKP